MKWINKSHLLKHGVSMEEFIIKYPNAELKSKDLITKIKEEK